MDFCHPAPCKTCPFRRLGGFRLRRHRLANIVASITERGEPFWCHQNRLESSRTQCTGAILFVTELGIEPRSFRIARALGLLVDSALIGREEIFASIEELLSSADDG